MDLYAFLDDVDAADMAGSTLVDYRIQLDHLALFLKHRPLPADLTVETIKSCATWASENYGWKKATVAKFKRTVRAIWSRAHDAGLAEPPGKLGAPTLPRHSKGAWTEEEVARIIGAAAELPSEPWPLSRLWWVALLRWLHTTGARHDETMNVRRRDFRLELGVCRIPADIRKCGDALPMRLTHGTIEALERIWGPDRDARVFGAWPYDPQGKPWKCQDRWLRKVIVLSGVRGTPDLAAAILAGGYRSGDGRELHVELKAAVPASELFHHFRRTAATHQMIKCRDVKAVQRRLGHRQLSTTEGYIDWLQVDAARADELIDDVEAIKPAELRVVSAHVA